MLDTYREVITPEGVALHLPVAGPVPRAVAWGIDLAIRLGILMLVGTVLALLGAAGQGLYLILLFLIFWAYPILFEALWDGQTPGKKAMSLRVVNGDGAPVGWLAAITRNLLRTVDMLPFGYAAGLVACLADPHARRLGDMVAGTLVVHNERERDPAAAPVNAVIAPSARPAAGGAGGRGRFRRTRTAADARAAGRTGQHRRTLDRQPRPGRRAAPVRHGQLVAGAAMRQEQFVARHQREWQLFEHWLETRGNARHALAERNIGEIGDEDIPARYRRLCQQLALARKRGYSPVVTARLQALMQRGHNLLYRTPAPRWQRAVEFLLADFPRLVRSEAACMWAALALFVVPLVTMFVLAAVLSGTDPRS